MEGTPPQIDVEEHAGRPIVGYFRNAILLPALAADFPVKLDFVPYLADTISIPLLSQACTRRAAAGRRTGPLSLAA